MNPLPCLTCGHLHEVPRVFACECGCPDYVPFHWVWHSNLWDGPLSGMVRLGDGREVWAQTINENDPDGYYRSFGLYVLTPEQDADIRHKHREFQRLVGFNCDYPAGPVHGTAESRAEFYRLYPPNPREQYDTFAKNPCIGTARMLWYDPTDEDDEDDA